MLDTTCMHRTDINRVSWQEEQTQHHHVTCSLSRLSDRQLLSSQVTGFTTSHGHSHAHWQCYMATAMLTGQALKRGRRNQQHTMLKAQECNPNKAAAAKRLLAEKAVLKTP